MKSATYRLQDGRSMTVKYDPEQPCIICGLPVFEASMGGTVVCPWCDCGNLRDGHRGDFTRPWKDRYPEEYAAAYPPDGPYPEPTFTAAHSTARHQ